ncbi:hypothetical protein LY11_02282 [Pedobacter cryoconitis]|uniref:Signal transduction histidine kinase dimerisation/phosphoacceptor domain-containing protein n=2 Tax=Pedobacter cryoconitis TaxID=188932 RepID=A0A327SU60_9SPHI|nr:hypothetical protein LY11_02282 [Pedobacter cryoconitis]
MLAAICLLLVCILDYLTPLHIGGIGIFYMASIPIVMQESKKTIIYIAALATVLITLNYLYFSTISPSPEWKIPINRIISVAGLWVTAVIAMNYKQLQHQLFSQRTDYTETLEEVIFITSHKVRNPVTNIVKIIELLEDDHLSEQNIKEMMQHLRKSAKDLEIATREMTDTISEKEYNKEILSLSA